MRTIQLLAAGALVGIALHAQAKPEFEVATVRPSNPAEDYINASTPSLRVGGDRILSFKQATLRDLIMLAYGVGARQIQGPGFLSGSPQNPADHFDVGAKVPEGAKPEQVPLMLQALLAERFHLSLHHENKEMQVYALGMGKGAPKMKVSPEGFEGEAKCERSFSEREDATLAAVCAHMTGADIAQQIQSLAPGYFRDGPVVDAGTLKGVYDFKLEWITNGEANAGAPGPTMISAVEDQLGLKLEKRKQAMDVLVIDKLDRMPTDN